LMFTIQDLRVTYYDIIMTPIGPSNARKSKLFMERRANLQRIKRSQNKITRKRANDHKNVLFYY
jgi:hypothetical protein